MRKKKISKEFGDKQAEIGVYLIPCYEEIDKN